MILPKDTKPLIWGAIGGAVSYYTLDPDDIITKPFTYKDGGFAVPAGPGLGVELDRDKLKKYARLHDEEGEAGEFLDPYRPDWVPKLPLW